MQFCVTQMLYYIDSCNSIASGLNRALHISSSLNDEISKIRQEFLNADYPLCFINSVIKQLNDKLSEKSNEEVDYILPHDFFKTKISLMIYMKSK